MSSHLSASSSLRRSPVAASRRTITRKQRPQFFRFQVHWDALTLSTLADKEDGVLALLQPLISDSMIEDHAHHIADFRLCRGSKRTAVGAPQLTKPLFDSNGTDIPDAQAAPRWPDPSHEKVFVDCPCGV